MADNCDHGYRPQRGGDGDGSNGSCAVCEDIEELKAQLSQAQAEIAAAQLVAMLARRLLTLEEDQRSWSDGTWEACREELDGAPVAYDAARAKLKGTEVMT
jgi:hypothetical protein